MTKQLFFLLLVGMFFSTISAQAQWRNKYKCHNFYGNGITEYIISKSDKNNSKVAEYWYYTSRNAKRIKLVVLSTKEVISGMEGTTIVKVRFPNGKTIYTLEFVPGGLYCLAPNGKKQAYTYIPN
ncbi:hypothetical protein [Microscilla marina]|uniref:Lipoprotein n=1 Tax=Microscilla marina ATCC 23134 TaxID=313606 RepID=A1ZGA0_MICM2|nr:hypothetical protein [Microscilla marina]EAY30517.1 hypothetical protein M23134_03153 [Microscilla marina ATCC 23134]